MKKILNIVISVGLISGCAANAPYGTTPTVKEAQTQDIIQGTAIGAGVGAGAGALVGKLAGDTALGAIIGATVGAGLGYAGGNQMANKRGAYAEKHDTIENQIAQLDSTAQQLKEKITLITAQLESRKSEVLQLSQKNKLQSEDISKARRLLAQLEADIKENNELTSKTQNEIARIVAKIKEIEDSPTFVANGNELKIRDDLVVRRNDLLASLGKINGIDSELNSQKSTLSTLIDG